jgi:hypothetical protein
MDPLSIVVGALALVDTAEKVTTRLLDIYGAYKSAPKEMGDIAQQMTLCAGLIERFATSIKNKEEKIPKKFHEAVMSLVEQVCEMAD